MLLPFWVLWFCLKKIAYWTYLCVWMGCGLAYRCVKQGPSWIRANPKKTIGITMVVIILAVVVYVPSRLYINNRKKYNDCIDDFLKFGKEYA